MTGKQWLALNDPKYIKPAVKAAQTRRIPFSREALEQLSAGQVVRKVAGKYTQCSPLAFVGEEPGQAISPGQAKQFFLGTVRRRGKRGGKKH